MGCWCLGPPVSPGVSDTHSLAGGCWACLSFLCSDLLLSPGQLDFPLPTNILPWDLLGHFWGLAVGFLQLLQENPVLKQKEVLYSGNDPPGHQDVGLK